MGLNCSENESERPPRDPDEVGPDVDLSPLSLAFAVE